MTFPLASAYLIRVWNTRLQWAKEGRPPTERERELTLRFALTQQGLVGLLWAGGAVLFGLLNLPFSG